MSEIPDPTPSPTPEEMFSELNPPYSTIVADPPWPDEHKLTAMPGGGVVGHAIGIEAHYSTLSLDDICAMPVADIAADDAHLYLWTTNLHLSRTFAVMDAWGFKFKSLLTWCKTGQLGLGYYFRTNTEHVLFGVRGSLRTQDRSVGTYFIDKKRGHSVKPPSFFDTVEAHSPGPYVELFARQPRLGWDAWGYGYESQAS